MNKLVLTRSLQPLHAGTEGGVGWRGGREPCEKVAAEAQEQGDQPGVVAREALQSGQSLERFWSWAGWHLLISGMWV